MKSSRFCALFVIIFAVLLLSSAYAATITHDFSSEPTGYGWYTAGNVTFGQNYGDREENSLMQIVSGEQAGDQSFLTGGVGYDGSSVDFTDVSADMLIPSSAHESVSYGLTIDKWLADGNKIQTRIVMQNEGNSSVFTAQIFTQEVGNNMQNPVSVNYGTVVKDNWYNLAVKADGNDIGMWVDNSSVWSGAYTDYFTAPVVESEVYSWAFNYDEDVQGYADYLTASYNPVPIPSAAFLLGSSLVALFGIRRKMR